MAREAVDVSLFDVENVDTMPAVRDMTVGPVTTADVQEFCHRYHYTATGGSTLWRYGLWHGWVLLGVVSYNLPTRETCESVFGPDHVDKVWHMGRLSMADDAPRNSESRLIAGSLKAITRERPDVWAVLTYAATDVGHIGYVYQATNAIYTGMGGHTTYYVDNKGQRRTDHHTNDTRAKDAGWTKHQGGLKHRYVYVLGSKTQRRQRMALLRLEQLPYPKETP